MKQGKQGKAVGLCDGVLPDMGKHGGSVDAGTGCNTGQ